LPHDSGTFDYLPFNGHSLSEKEELPSDTRKKKKKKAERNGLVQQEEEEGV